MGMGTTCVSRGGGITRFLPSFHGEYYSRHESLNYASCAQQSADASLADVELEFLDHIDGDTLIGQSENSHEFHPNEMELDHHEDECEEFNNGGNEENKNFWDNQLQILQTNLYRTSSLESRIRKATKEAVQDYIHNAEIECSCSTRQVAASSCRNCLMREVSRRLQNAGFNSAICKTKWKSSPTIPSGEHSFLDVIENSSKEKGSGVRVIIELNLRAEFEMAKASEEYNRLVRRLPEMYVGKVERMSNIIKVLCMAGKRCMKENKMHMGPWRKHKYMQAKWLGPCKRNTSTTSLSMGYSDEMRILPKPKTKASMLTVDLLEKLPNMHCTPVEVV